MRNVVLRAVVGIVFISLISAVVQAQRFSVTPIPDIDINWIHSFSDTGAVQGRGGNLILESFYWDSIAGRIAFPSTDLNGREITVEGMNKSGQVLGDVWRVVGEGQSVTCFPEGCLPPDHYPISFQLGFVWQPGQAFPSEPTNGNQSFAASFTGDRHTHTADDINRLLVLEQTIVHVTTDEFGSGGDTVKKAVKFSDGTPLASPFGVEEIGGVTFSVGLADYNGTHLLWDDENGHIRWQEVGGGLTDVTASILDQVAGATNIRSHALLRDGRIVGNFSLQGDTKPFAWSPDGTIELLPGANGFRLSINDLGWVLNDGELFIGGQQVVVNDHLDSNAEGWSVSGVTFLNDRGQMVAWGQFNDGPRQSMLLTAEFFRWTNAFRGDWGGGANWSDGEAPGEDDVAEFSLAATYTVDFPQPAASKTASIQGGAVTFQMTDQQYVVKRLEVLNHASQGATLNVAGDIVHRSGIIADEVVVGKSGTIKHAGQAYVGYTTFSDTDVNRLLTDLHAKRSLRLENGGQMESPQGKVIGPAESDGTGVATVNIDGAGSIWEVTNLEVGGLAAGRINITGGGELNVFPNGRIDAPTAASESTISVNGFATLGEQIVPSRLIASNLQVGVDGYARIHVSGRGQVGADSAVLGETQGSRGIVIVEGQGTKWLGANTEANTIAVGRDGRGELIIRDGADFRASISVGELSSLDEGIVTIDGKGPSTPPNEQTFVKSFNVSVGRAGLGEMIIRKGAQFEAGAIRLGDLFGGNGVIQVLDAGTKMTVENFITLGGIGAGGLLIKDGAIVEGPLALVNVEGGGVVEIRNGSRLDIGGMNIDPGGLVVGDAGSLVLPGEEFLVNNGTLRIGSSPGQFTIDGNYRQGESGIIEIELAGLTPSDEFDVLNVTGDSDIGGTVQLKFIDSFAPQQGQTFEFLTVGGMADLSGASFEIQNLAPGFMFDITPSADGIMMTALSDGVFVPDPVSGDYNRDGVVDAADYVVWRNNGGTQPGYNTWRANFGRTVGSGGSGQSTNVPEPTIRAMLALMLGAAAMPRHQKNARTRLYQNTPCSTTSESP